MARKPDAPRTSTVAPVRSFVLTEDLCAKLDKAEATSGQKKSEIVRRALTAYLK